MYAVVGCSKCSALWVVEGRPETTQCPRCGTRKRFDRLKQFVTTDDPDRAKQARAAMLAERQEMGEAFDDLDDFSSMGDRLDEAGIDDDTYLESSGVDPEAAEQAGKRAEQGTGGSRSRKAVVTDALDELAEPTRDAIVAYAQKQGVAEDYVDRALEKLRRTGEITESNGVYRRL
ncbi:DUF5817 domain-containing protein [Halapricum hydrolyticum]|uniref:DUF5817 domain-containing protein n=1 Tax=Halapricum hydrolyticum TaxID=2979991 RepID=A0AAE3I9U1_9EURY|nr:DUF5817 domain-containing protein [Halapricum hydrolyticum]MCU4717401.1 DUF5817 domain-containing protein [Halapricum hydrolyticum]MCU4726565.1 DUF5817 domain-containing protein [Halapricum hydrolyticum]